MEHVANHAKNDGDSDAEEFMDDDLEDALIKPARKKKVQFIPTSQSKFYWVYQAPLFAFPVGIVLLLFFINSPLQLTFM